MVDIEQRQFLSEQLRHLISGQINNLQYDELDLKGRIDSDDRAVREIFYQSWLLYDDFKIHKIELSNDGRTEISRWIIFLHTNLEYEWPQEPCFISKLYGNFVKLISFGQVSKNCENKPSEVGDREVWPFFRRTDYEKALQNPRLLSGVA